MEKPHYSFVTTCKGRLHHLKQTLPSLIKTRCAEIIVVDYNCPDKAADWISENFPLVTVVRVTDDDGFSLPRARNIGAQHVKSPWVVFIDGDVFIHDGWDAWIQRYLVKDSMYRAGPVNGTLDPETYGTFICEKSAFDRIGGYDEAFSGWGGEDEDIYRRLIAAAITRRAYPGTLVSAISHGDEERLRFSDLKDIKLRKIIHEIYMRAKSFYAGISEGREQLTIESRKKILAMITERVTQWDRQGRPVGESIKFSNKHARWLPSPYAMGVESAITISIMDRNDVRKPSAERAALQQNPQNAENSMGEPAAKGSTANSSARIAG